MDLVEETRLRLRIIIDAHKLIKSQMKVLNELWDDNIEDAKQLDIIDENLELIS